MVWVKGARLPDSNPLFWTALVWVGTHAEVLSVGDVVDVGVSVGVGTSVDEVDSIDEVAEGVSADVGVSVGVGTSVDEDEKSDSVDSVAEGVWINEDDGMELGAAQPSVGTDTPT
jgi:hypothetical protein